MPTRFRRSTRRLMMLVALLPLAVLVMGSIYMLVMEHLEGSPRTFLESMQWATETLTTTGYGNDSHWRHPAVALFVILGQFMGQFLVFLIFPVFVLPYFEERFEVRLPHALPKMDGKVLFYRYSPALEFVVEEFRRTHSPFVIFEENIDTARALRDRGLPVIFGHLGEETGFFERIRQARALVSNAGDHGNAHCTLIAREQGYRGPIYALADEPLYRPPLISIGATDVFTPAHVLGGALAARASVRIAPAAEGLHLLGTKLAFSELRLRSDSVMIGKTVHQANLRATHGVAVVGQWQSGHFSGATAAQPLEAGNILIVVGRPEDVSRFESEQLAVRRKGHVVIAGFGTVGQKVLEMLKDAGETCVVIDLQPAPGVDVVGNVLERNTLLKARVLEASAVVLALNDDSEALFAAAALRDHAPVVPIIARVGRTQNIDRLYRAGADFAISVGQVAGQILAYHLLDEQLLPVETHLRLSRVTSGRLVGTFPLDPKLAFPQGATLVAVVRDENVLVDLPPDFRLVATDTVFVCGSSDAISSLQTAFSMLPVKAV